MKKHILGFMVVISILAILIPVIVSYASISEEQTIENKIFYSEIKQACIGDTVEMYLDLSKIDAESFTFTIESKQDNVNLEEITPNEPIEGKVENNTLEIIFSEKTEDVEKLSFFYKIPSNLKVGTKIKLLGKIEKTKATGEDNNETENPSEIIEQTIEIEIVEKTTNTEKEEHPTDIEQNVGKIENEIKEMNKKENNTNINKSVNQKSLSTIQANKGTTKEIITYKGDNNNYLKSLSITGYNINPEFIKTTNTYFITVPENISSIKIKAEAEKNSAKVNIYGNTNLNKKENKVLVSVTAENGDVRTYRIYVMKEE